MKQQRVEVRPLQGAGGLGQIVEGSQQLHRSIQPAQQRGSLQPGPQGGANHRQPPGSNGWCVLPVEVRVALGGRQRLCMRGGHALELRHIQRRQRADGMTQVCQMFDQRQALNVLACVQALTAWRQLRVGQPVAPLPHAQGRHRHLQHARHGAAAVK